LEVEVIISQTGKSSRAVITPPNSQLNSAQVDRIVRKLQKVKFYPRDFLENRLLLSYGERLIGELPPELREELSQWLDSYENGMRSGDRKLFEQSRQQLLIWLSERGFPYDGVIDDDAESTD
jgi:molecular chaperone HscC